MIIAVCRLQLSLPGCASLKEKRGRLKPVLARLPKEFNVAVAEVGHHDVWQSAEIAAVTVLHDDVGAAHRNLTTLASFVERHFPDVEVLDANIEIR